jgi:hypothetical protein
MRTENGKHKNGDGELTIGELDRVTAGSLLMDMAKQAAVGYLTAVPGLNALYWTARNTGLI